VTGGRESKNKNHARETKEKKLVHQKILKKKFVQRLFNRENYKFFVYKLA
jgi:mannitol/fructose-specific phosphotransferase system IIA component